MSGLQLACAPPATAEASGAVVLARSSSSDRRDRFKGLIRSTTTVMDHDQYIEVPASQPALHFQPPTPLTSTSDYPSSTFTIPIPTSSRSTSPISIPRPATSLSRSSSTRHHPYSASPASFNERSFRPRSATSASDRSDWETDAGASFDLYGSSVDSSYFTPSSSYGFSLPTPSAVASLDSLDSPYVASTDSRGKSGKAAKSHSRKTAPGHIKRPPNAFILFRSHCCSMSADVDPSVPQPPGSAHARELARLEINNSQHISTIVGDVWKGLSKEDKAYWEQKAREAKEEHQRLHPDYRYRPQARPKEQGRRRKRTDPKETNKHREACHEVARQVLEIHRSREPTLAPLDASPDGDLPIPPEMLAAALDQANELWPASADPLEEPLAPKPEPAAAPAKKKRVRKAPARKAKAIKGASPEAIFSMELPGEPTPTLPHPPAFQSLPNASPFLPLEAHGDFSSSGVSSFGAYGRRVSQTRTTQVYGSSDAVEQFGFMAQLNSQAPLEPNLAHLDPQLAALNLSSRPGTSAAPPVPAGGAGPFSSFYAAQPLQPTSTSYALQDATAIERPASPRSAAIQQMQHYTLGGPTSALSPFGHLASTHPEPSPLGTTFSFGTAPSGPARRISVNPSSLSFDALKQRRGTLRPGGISSTDADLVLVSPLATAFGRRKSSLSNSWNFGLRRLSGIAAGLQAVEGAAPNKSSYARTAVAPGVISAGETYEKYTFSADVLSSLPQEDPLVTEEFFAQLAAATGIVPGLEEDESSRPSTAYSDWSTDGDEIERLQGDLPVGYLDRRRSTIVPSNFSSAFSSAANSTSTSPSAPFSAPAAEGQFHIGATDFFTNPTSPLASAAPSVSSFAVSSAPLQQQQQHTMPAFGSAEFGNSFQPFSSRLATADPMLAAAAPLDHFSPPPPPTASHHASPDFPVGVDSHDGQWAPSAAMRDTALSILQERRQVQHEVGQPQGFVEQQNQPHQQEQQPSFIYLGEEQLQRPDFLEVIEKIHQQGYGVAFPSSVTPFSGDISSPPPPSHFSPHALPSGETSPY
ncbi:hypothetical protein JCM8097_004330 [Rhodosporidiobolus ruineniae]